jgi:hypothetical protein
MAVDEIKVFVDDQGRQARTMVGKDHTTGKFHIVAVSEDGCLKVDAIEIDNVTVDLTDIQTAAEAVLVLIGEVQASPTANTVLARLKDISDIAQAEGTWADCIIANGETTSAAVDVGRNYRYLQVVLPELTSGSLSLHVSEAIDGTYQELKPNGESAVYGPTTGQHNDTWWLLGWQFVKIVSSAAQGAERTFRVRGTN